MISQSSVSCAWPKLGVNVIFSNERVIEIAAIFADFHCFDVALAVTRRRRDHRQISTGGAA
jgi:hypothetical protein